jgi:hypothetical protein
LASTYILLANLNIHATLTKLHDDDVDNNNNNNNNNKYRAESRYNAVL